MLHEGEVFGSTPTDTELHSGCLPVNEPAKLAVLSIAADPTLMGFSRASTLRLHVLVSSMCASLHPLSSVVAFVPQPWHKHRTLVSANDVVSLTGISRILVSLRLHGNSYGCRLPVFLYYTVQ